MKRTMVALLAAVLLVGTPLGAAPAGATERSRCFGETGFCVSGRLLEYWERNGGLAVFGYPISAVAVEQNNDGWSGPTQWFERDRLEDHGPDGILAGRLGAQYLKFQGREWEQFARVTDAPPGCRFFAETGHSLCGVFLRYWTLNGGLERFGYPISEPIEEATATWSGTAQYFERRRMELHPEHSGTPFSLLLGLLGRELRDPYGCKDVVLALQKTAAAFPETFGCAAPFPHVNTPIAVEQFERGTMVWVPGRNNGQGWIWAISSDARRGSIVWELHADTWTAAEPIGGGEQPPPGLYEPARGFGKLWRTTHLRNTLGWAIAPEVATTGSQQYFKGGAWLLHRADLDRVFLLYPDNRADDLPRIR